MDGNSAALYIVGMAICIAIQFVVLVACLARQRRQKHAEEAVRQSEAKFRTIFEYAPVGIVINRLSDSVRLDFNQKFEEMTSFSRSEMLGKTTRDLTRFVDPSDPERIRQEYLERGRLDNYYLRVVEQQNIQHALVSIYPITWGDEACTVSLVTDITALKQAEETVRESEERLRAFIEQTSEGVMMMSD